MAEDERQTEKHALASTGENTPSNANKPEPIDATSSSTPLRQGYTFTKTEKYEGFIPAHLFEQYERTETGKQYVEALIQQSHHRMDLERRTVYADNKRAHTGQWMAFVITFAFLAVGSWLVWLGHDWAGAAITTGCLVGLVTTFVVGSSLRKNERIEKMKLIAPLASHEDKD